MHEETSVRDAIFDMYLDSKSFLYSQREYMPGECAIGMETEFPVGNRDTAWLEETDRLTLIRGRLGKQLNMVDRRTSVVDVNRRIILDSPEHHGVLLFEKDEDTGEFQPTNHYQTSVNGETFDTTVLPYSMMEPKDGLGTCEYIANQACLRLVPNGTKGIQHLKKIMYAVADRMPDALSELDQQTRLEMEPVKEPVLT